MKRTEKSRIRLICWVCGLLVLMFGANAQELTLPVYDLTISEQDLSALLANPWSPVTYPATITHDSIDYSCQVNFRGATSLDLPKKSWKINFDDHGPLGWEETNLNAEYRDRSLARNALCLELSRQFGLPTPDTRYVSMLVNDQYWGVYLEVESIDEGFFQRRGGQVDALFKAISHACRFAPAFDPERLAEYYEPKITERGSLDTLAARFVFIQEAPAGEIEAHIEELVDVSDIMTYFALQYAVRNSDGYTKNFYITVDESRIYRLLPWDCDATLGNDWAGEFVDQSGSLEMGALAVQAIFQRLTGIDENRDAFHATVQEMVQSGFDTLAVRAQQIHDQILHDVCLDTFKRGSNEEFENAHTDLLSFMEDRRAALNNMPLVKRIDALDYRPTSDHLGVVGDTFFVSVKIAEEIDYVHAILINESSDEFWVELNDDGLNGDSIAGDSFYSRNVSLPGVYPQFYYCFRMVPINGLDVSFWPPAGNLNHWYYPLHLPVIGYDSSPTMAEHVIIESAVETVDHETHAVILRNIADRNIQLSGYVVRLGNSARMGRISREHHLVPGQALVFTNHPDIMQPYFPDDLVAGGYYFPVQPGDTVFLETSSGDVLMSQVIEEITLVDEEHGDVVVNEINYNSAADFNPGDWIELHAPHEAVSLFNWVLRDEDDTHGFIFPLEAILPAGGYVIVAEDPAAFAELFPAVNNVFGPTGFGLGGGGDAVRVFDAAGAEIDNVIFDDAAPWPTEPDGNGPTLELINPLVDNSDPQFWRGSSGATPHGTPGLINSVYTDADEPVFPVLPQDWRIVNVYPNPFNSETRIDFVAPFAQQSAIMIFDLLGRITQQIPVRVGPGLHSVVWKGDTENGSMASSGLYFIRIGSPGLTTARKVVLLR